MTSQILTTLLVLLGTARSARLRSKESLVHLANSTVDNVPMFMYRQDCFRKRPVSSLLQMTPGVGMNPESIVPFETVLKDGYFRVECVKDMMYYHGDKFGNNKYDYTMGNVSNVSIVRYDEIVPKVDREKMSPAVCFAFCRTVPGVLFFGILNGRHCYCTPYYQRMASDSNACDSICEGDTTQMCGGKAKSNIWEMHLCSNTEKEVLENVAVMVNMSEPLAGLAHNAKSTAKDYMQMYGQKLQDMFGQSGDPVASELCQVMKVHAGSLLKVEETSVEILAAVEKLQKDVAGHDLSSMDFDDAEKSEAFAKKAAYITEAAFNVSTNLGTALFVASPESKGGFGLFEGAYNTSANASSQYYPIMYFVDKEFEDVPTTCGGEVLGSLVSTMDGCATACDSRYVGHCVGFMFMGADASQQGFCFLIKEFKTAQYYTGCGEGASLLQHAKTNSTKRRSECASGFKCMAKLSEFEGTTLAPDASGKCKKCLKEAVKAARCFEVPEDFGGCGGLPIEDVIDVPIIQPPVVETEVVKAPAGCTSWDFAEDAACTTIGGSSAPPGVPTKGPIKMPPFIEADN